MSSIKYIAAVMALALVGCAPEKPSDRLDETTRATAPAANRQLHDEPVVTVDGESVTLGEFERRIRELPEFARMRYSTVQRKQAYLDSLARFEVMADEAERRGLGERVEVLEAMKRTLAERLVEQVVREKVSMKDISDQELRHAYQERKEQYHQPLARRVVLIESDHKKEADQLRARLVDRLPDARDARVRNIRQAAAKFSVDRAVASKGGDVGFVSTPEANPEAPVLSRLVFALDEAGQLSPVFELDGRWAVATFIDERPEHTINFERAARDLREELYEQRRKEARRAFVDNLRDKATIEIDRQVVERMQPPEPPAMRRPEEIPVKTVPAFASDKGARASGSSQQ